MAVTFYTNCNYNDLLWASNVHNHRTVCHGCKCADDQSDACLRDPGEMSSHKIGLLTAMSTTTSCINSKDFIIPQYSHYSNYLRWNHCSCRGHANMNFTASHHYLPCMLAWLTQPVWKCICVLFFWYSNGIPPLMVLCSAIILLPYKKNIKNAALFQLLLSLLVCCLCTNQTCKIGTEALQPLVINCSSCRGGRLLFKRVHESRSKKKIQLTLNISIYEVLWNLKPVTTTGYKTFPCPWSENIGISTQLLFTIPQDNWQGHVEIVHILLMNARLDASFHSCEV